MDVVAAWAIVAGDALTEIAAFGAALGAVAGVAAGTGAVVVAAAAAAAGAGGAMRCAGFRRMTGLFGGTGGGTGRSVGLPGTVNYSRRIVRACVFRGIAC